MDVKAEELVGDEWAEWYRLTPLQRWQESEKLWQPLRMELERLRHRSAA